MCELERWLQNATDRDVQNELHSILGQEDLMEDRFYRELSFGTGGLRGILGAGTNRMNRYTVGRATMGLADYLIASNQNSVVIAYDSRNQSAEFALLSAQIMSSKGIHAYLFSELTPTPVLSFAVRYLKAGAGIVITASHNPKEYNGYKVYNSRGCQITDRAAEEITQKIQQCDYFTPFTPDTHLISMLDDRIKQAFLKRIQADSQSVFSPENAPAVVYSPLNGTGRDYVQSILRMIGVKSLYTVAEQEMPDSNFTTCPFPNPEETEALALSLRDAKRYRPDLVMATDPDADRIGIAVPNSCGKYVLLNGNETGSILLYYMLLIKQTNNALRKDTTVIKTIVTTDVIFDMAKEFGICVKEVLTGFKYIGEALDETEDYLLGLEESYGYLVGTHARDKDAVSAAMMIAQACAYFKEQGKTLYSVLQEIEQRYGYYRTSLKTITLCGKGGAERMQAMLEAIRKAPFASIDGEPLTFDDFSNGLYGLPKSPVLRFRSEHYRLILRPSGTEPKMKIYLQVKGNSPTNAKEKLLILEQFLQEQIG